VSLTTDPQDPRLGHGSDTEPGQQNAVYLVLPEAERRKGFSRPLYRAYIHHGAQGPRYPVRDLTDEERERYAGYGYVKHEAYPLDDHPVTGRFWTQAQLDNAGKGCGTVTTMGLALCETYRASPAFYSATWCCGCRMHKPVGKDGEFTWIAEDGTDTHILVGT
jgi:hypothetical protein